jgi:hypothetical protein
MCHLPTTNPGKACKMHSLSTLDGIITISTTINIIIIFINLHLLNKCHSGFSFMAFETLHTGEYCPFT